MRKTLITLIVLSVSLGLSAQNLKKSVTWEQIQCHPAELPCIGQIATIKSDLNKPSLWSVGCETLDRDYSNFENYKQYVGETGVGYARLQSGWAKTEKVKGQYDFSWIEKHIDGLLEQGIHPWVCLCYGNPIYSDGGHDLNAKLFDDGPVMDGWLNYVKAFVKHFKGKVTMYEIWNESDNGKMLDTYAQYANIYLRSAKIIRKLDPPAKICAIGSCSPDRKYIRQVLECLKEKDALSYVDCVTYHSYWPYPETVINAVKQLKKDVAAFSPDIKVLQGETGCPGQLEYGHAMCNIEWNEYSQAKWDLRSMMNHFGLGVPYSVFTMVDLNYGWMIQSYGLLRMNLLAVPQYKRPKFHAVQHMTSIFTPEFEADENVKVEVSGGHKIASVGIKKNGVPVGCAIWFADGRPTGSLEKETVSVKIEGADFHYPVYVNVLDGKVHALTQRNVGGTLYAESVPLWDCPILIINRNCINLKK